MSTPTLLTALVLIGPVAACAQDAFHLNPTLAHRTYRDDRIIVRAPPGWTLAIETEITGGNPVRIARVAILRKGPYVLHLCSGCMQASGIEGGRFSEISSLVQPNARPDWGADPSPCGNQRLTPISPALNRVDLWYNRKDRRLEPEGDRCRTPQGSATFWYGSYFTNHCPANLPPDDGCGGNFLLRSRLSHKPPVGDDIDEMAYGLAFSPAKPSLFPRRKDSTFRRILLEATAIVNSIQYR